SGRVYGGHETRWVLVRPNKKWIATAIQLPVPGPSWAELRRCGPDRRGTILAVPGGRPAPQCSTHRRAPNVLPAQAGDVVAQPESGGYGSRAGGAVCAARERRAASASPPSAMAAD